MELQIEQIELQMTTIQKNIFSSNDLSYIENGFKQLGELLAKKQQLQELEMELAQ
jgi:hypothetical protein